MVVAVLFCRERSNQQRGDAQFKSRAFIQESRAAEVAAMKRADIDFDSGEMQIEGVKTGKYFPMPLLYKVRMLLEG
jgi:integrase